MKKEGNSDDEFNYARWLALLVTAKAVIILVALAIILFFRAIF